MERWPRVWVLEDVDQSGAGAGEKLVGAGPGMYLVQAGADGAELGGDVGPEGLQGDDGDHGDEGQEEAVLHHAGATLAVGVELGLDPGLQHEKVHGILLRYALEALVRSEERRVGK